MWVPSRDPKQLPLCEECKSIYEMYRRSTATCRTRRTSSSTVRGDRRGCASARRCGRSCSIRRDRVLLVRFEFPDGHGVGDAGRRPGAGRGRRGDAAPRARRGARSRRRRDRAAHLEPPAHRSRSSTGGGTASATGSTSCARRPSSRAPTADVGAAAGRTRPRAALVDARRARRRGRRRRVRARGASPSCWPTLLADGPPSSRSTPACDRRQAIRSATTRCHSSTVSAERLDVDALVVAVEPAAELGRVDGRAEQPGAVGDGAELAEHPGVGEADGELRRQPGAGERHGDGPLQRVPQRGVDAADRRRVVHQDLDLDVVGEVAERGPQVGGRPRRCPRRAACGRRRRGSIESGITLVFITPPSIRFGENVVWVQAWRWAAAAAFGQRRRARRRCAAGSSSAALSSSGTLQRLDPGRPQLVEPGRRPVLGEPLHDGGRLDERVVDAERHRAVARRAADAQPPPRHALLGRR